MIFERYLSSSRPAIRFQRNPPADVLEKEIHSHLNVVRRWINGDIDTAKMRQAMKFFTKEFNGAYRPNLDRYVYRGQGDEVFDGTPRSYTYDKEVAEGFAESQHALFGSKPVLLVKRKVCFRCADSRAFETALDLGKLMKAYTGHKYGTEKEVVILNTRPVAKTAQLFEVAA